MTATLTMTEEQAKQLARTQAAIGESIIERYALLAEFLDEIGLSDTHEIVQNADRFVADVAKWIDNHPVDTTQLADRLLVTSLFIGEVLAQRWSGCWLLVDKPDSPNFANYVVGKFKKLTRPGAVANPFLIATKFLQERETGGKRGFARMLVDAEKDLQTP